METSLASVEEWFAFIEANSQGHPTDTLLWHFVFCDASYLKLRRLARHLGREGYRRESLRRDPESLGKLDLVVTRVERHTPASLHQRNLEFNALATEFGLSSYGGNFTSL